LHPKEIEPLAERTAWQRIAKRIRVPMGFLVAAVFLWFARPSAVTLFSSLLLVLPGLWLRAYAAGYVRKNAELTTTGPYGYTRNPLYLGSMGIAFGFGIAAGNWMLVVLLVVLFLAIYLPTIQGEEEYLAANFPGFATYRKHVPRLLPRLTPAPRLGEGGAFSRQLYLHHREYNALMGAGAIYLALTLKCILERRELFAGLARH
jgi:protein-S-isoprenylcysteine O-methyltransferase Ste14